MEKISFIVFWKRFPLENELNMLKGSSYENQEKLRGHKIPELRKLVMYRIKMKLLRTLHVFAVQLA